MGRLVLLEGGGESFFFSDYYGLSLTEIKNEMKLFFFLEVGIEFKAKVNYRQLDFSTDEVIISI